MMRTTPLNPPEAGFTIVEMGIIVPIVLIVALSLFAILLGMIGSSDVDKARSQMLYEQETAMSTIESDVRLATGFLTTNDTNDTDPYQTSGWDYDGAGSTSRVLILRSFSTVSNPLSNTRSPVFIGSGTSCNTANLPSDPLQTYDTVYFVSGTTLYRRRLIDTTGTPTCQPQYQKLSCPIGNPSGYGSCGADDEVISQDVSGFAIDYYTDGSSQSPVAEYNGDPNALAGVSSIGVTLTLSIAPQNRAVTTTDTLRMSALNGVGG